MLKKHDIKPIEKPKHKYFKGGKGIASNFAQGFDVPKKWYEELTSDPKDFPKVTDTVLIELKDEAKKCNDAEVATYSIKNSKTNSDYQWMKTVMAKGTVSDKIAAYTILIQDDPVCNLSTVQNMINMVKVGKKKECLIVMDTLAELFISDLLIPDTKLKSFYERPISKLDELTSGNASTRRKYLSIWYFEDQLKESYTQFVLALNKAAHDSVEANKEKAIGAMYKLLSGNPEQEKNLLANIVNKLGDPSQKVASKSIYCLGQLLHAHPAMKRVVLNEIEKLLFRPNVSTKAQYYSICFLTQFYLSHEDYDLAKNLISTYFAFFKACIKKGDVDSRMMSALLMGVNRAYPYAKSELSQISEHIDTMYKIVHVANFNVSLHTLNLLFQISDLNDSINDRFYSALYKKLLDHNVGTTTHQALFLNLVFRALKRDKNLSRVRTFIKRLLQVTLFMQPSMACGILFLVFHIMYRNTGLLATTIKSDAMTDDDEEEHFVDVKIEDDTEPKQTETTETPITTENETKDVKTVIDLAELDKDNKADITLNESNISHGSSWVHTDRAIKSEFNHPPITCYNPLQRNPLYAGGEFCAYTELLSLQQHFHPTVALFATKIINEENISYSGDPLKDFTLIRFLERFSFKNPKTAESVQKPGINPIFGKRKLYVAKGLKSHAVTSSSYLSASKDKIPVEEMFMYKYLQKRNENRPIKEENDDESDADSVASDEFEEMISKMSGKKNFSDDDEDLDFMKDVGDKLKNSKDKDSDDDLDDEDDDSVLSDESNDFGDEDINELDDKEQGFEDIGDDGDDEGDDDLMADFDDEDESDIEFNESDEESKQVTPQKKKKSGKKGKKGDDINTMFASADEFAAILDEEPDFMAGTSHAVSNKDKAHKKQLSWEQNRHNWLQGGDKKSGKPKGKKFNSNKKFGNKKRPNKSQFGNKNKKQKRF